MPNFTVVKLGASAHDNTKQIKILTQARLFLDNFRAKAI